MSNIVGKKISCVKSIEPLQGYSLPIYISVPRSSWYSFNGSRKDKRLSWLWSHPEALKTGSTNLWILASLSQMMQYPFISIIFTKGYTLLSLQNIVFFSCISFHFYLVICSSGCSKKLPSIYLSQTEIAWA